jgi:quercetin dioxygenase-like cupin family protein
MGSGKHTEHWDVVIAPTGTWWKLGIREIFPGLRARLVHTDRVSHSWVDIDAGAAFPEHHHPHEQVVSVIEGELELVVDGVPHRLVQGLVFVIPPTCPTRPRHHGVPRARHVCAGPRRLPMTKVPRVPSVPWCHRCGVDCCLVLAVWRRRARAVRGQPGLLPGRSPATWC